MKKPLKAQGRCCRHCEGVIICRGSKVTLTLTHHHECADAGGPRKSGEGCINTELSHSNWVKIWFWFVCFSPCGSPGGWRQRDRFRINVFSQNHFITWSSSSFISRYIQCKGASVPRCCCCLFLDVVFSPPCAIIINQSAETHHGGRAL